MNRTSPLHSGSHGTSTGPRHREMDREGMDFKNRTPCGIGLGPGGTSSVRPRGSFLEGLGQELREHILLPVVDDEGRNQTDRAPVGDVDEHPVLATVPLNH